MSRFILPTVLLLAAAGGAFAAHSQLGAPWGLGTKPAVVLEAVGAIEHQSQAGRGAVRAGDVCKSGDELRASVLSHAVLRTKGGTLTIGDGAQVKCVRQGGFSLMRGAAELTPEPTRGDGAVLLTLPAAKISFETSAGTLHVMTAGGVLSATATGGDVNYVVTGGGPQVLKDGQALSGAAGVFKVSAKPDALALRADVKRKKGAHTETTVAGTTSHFAAIYMNGELSFPNAEGDFRVSLPAGAAELTVMARDPFGHTQTVMLKP